MSEEIRITIPPTGATVEIAVYCLRTDSWDDYRAFLTDAQAASDAGNIRTVNRFLRAALMCFFAHVEGVVKHIEEGLNLPPEITNRPLYRRMQNITQKAKRKGHRVPSIEFRIEKFLRDIVAHPGIEKGFRDPEEDTILTQGDVYERLDIETLEQLQAKVTPWLRSVCNAFGVSPFTETAELCQGLARDYGNEHATLREA